MDGPYIRGVSKPAEGGEGRIGALGCKGAIAHIHVVSSCAHPEAIVRILVWPGGGVSWPVKRPTQGTLDKASLPSTGQRLSLMRGLLGADDLT